jgi:Lrp/AsnC family leucine-responsive transcriptional regulator
MARIQSIDWKILVLLQHNARIASTEIGKLVGLSQPAVTSRIQRLEDAGVIEGYTARVNAKKVGREISALIRLKTSHAHIHACLKLFDRAPEILEAYRITGEDCFVVKAAFDRMTRLESTIDALANLDR